MKKLKQQHIFLCILFILFIPNFYNNYWNIGNLNVAYFESEGNILDIEGYDPYPNMLIIGRLNESKQNGIFSNAGLPGLNYKKNSVPDSIIQDMFTEQPRYIILYHNIISEYNTFMNDEKSPDNYMPYISQIGGQGIVFSILNKILPFTNKTNYKLIKLFNASLVSLAFVLFIGWSLRNFGLLPAITTFILIFFSPWLSLLGSGLWWSIWGLYLPFLSSLLILEQKHQYPDKIKNKDILLTIFIGVFLKCIFTGYEFSTSTLLAIYCPLIYYGYLNKSQIKELVILSVKMGISALIAVFLTLNILILQIKYVMGGFTPAIDYIKNSYIRRTSFQSGSIPDNIFEIVIKRYFKEDGFFLGFINSSSPFTYMILTCIFIVCSIFLFFYGKNKNKRNYIAISLTTVFSLLCPLSWFYIFVQHSHQHPFYDNIVWYIPYCLYGFLTIGIILNILIQKMRYRK